MKRYYDVRHSKGLDYRNPVICVEDGQLYYLELGRFDDVPVDTWNEVEEVKQLFIRRRITSQCSELPAGA